MNKNQSTFRAKFHSMELWDGDTLIAGTVFPFLLIRFYSVGELGYVVGGIYTSLTGGSTVASGGTTQLCLTGILLEKLDFLWWDFEMSHPYKLSLGMLL
jgi:hypothetical protein